MSNADNKSYVVSHTSAVANLCVCGGDCEKLDCCSVVQQSFLPWLFLAKRFAIIGRK